MQLGAYLKSISRFKSGFPLPDSVQFAKDVHCVPSYDFETDDEQDMEDTQRLRDAMAKVNGEDE